MHKYASDTPESRELIAELEFVWEQVKSNSLPSSSSSQNRGCRAGRDQQQDPDPSYATLTGGANGKLESSRGLRLLVPMSDKDLEEEDESDDPDEEPDAERQLRNSHIRKWRKRIERTLIRMTAEIAALKEQLEARRGSHNFGGRSGGYAWLTSFVWSTIKHIAVDAVVLAMYVAWSKRKSDQTIGEQLQMIMSAASHRAQTLNMQKLRALRRPWGRGTDRSSQAL